MRRPTRKRGQGHVACLEIWAFEVVPSTKCVHDLVPFSNCNFAERWIFFSVDFACRAIHYEHSKNSWICTFEKNGVTPFPIAGSSVLSSLPWNPPKSRAQMIWHQIAKPIWITALYELSLTAFAKLGAYEIDEF